MPDEPSVAGRHETDSAPAPRFTALEGGSDCLDCVSLREQNRLLAEHNLVLLTRVRAFEERDRLGADMLLGLAGLQRVEVAG